MKKEDLFEIIGEVDEQKVADAGKAMYAPKSTTVVWRRWGALAACLFLVVAAAFAVPGIIGFMDTGEDQYANTVAYAGWSADSAIYDGALNKEFLQDGKNAHLPVFKMDTLEDLAQFKSNYSSVFTMDQGYGNLLSFEGALAKAQWDRENFYEEHSLLIIYVPANSGTYQFGIQSVAETENSMCVYIEQKNDPEAITADLAGWFVLVEVEDEEISNYTTFDAILRGLD